MRKPRKDKRKGRVHKKSKCVRCSSKKRKSKFRKVNERLRRHLSSRGGNLMEDLFNHNHEDEDRVVAAYILEENFNWELRDHPNPYEKCIDLEAFVEDKKVADIEIERRSSKSTGGWGKDKDFSEPFITVPFRKWKLVRGFNSHYIILSHDYHAWGIIMPDTIKKIFTFNLHPDLEVRPKNSNGEPTNRTSKDMPKQIMNQLIENHNVIIKPNSRQNEVDWGDMFFKVPSSMVKWDRCKDE